MPRLCLDRRALLAGLVGCSLAGASCARKERCRTCGMILDPLSRFRVEIRRPSGVERYDTPKCAFQALRSGTTGDLYALGYYGQALLPSSELLFAAGSDVLGPMGIDLVPVEREHGKRFASEHGAKQLYEEAAVTREVLRDLS